MITPTEATALAEKRAAFEEMMRRDYPLFPLKAIETVSGEILHYASSGTQHMWNGWLAARAVQSAQLELTVWYGAMPESNGRSNFTATLMRKGASMFDTDSYTFARSEYPDRVRYEADCMRYLIGERCNKPWILDYDDEKHSGYTAPVPAPATVDRDAVLDTLEQCVEWIENITGEQLELWRSVKVGELQRAIRALKGKAAPAPVAVAPVAGEGLTDAQIEAAWDSLDGKAIIAGENQLNWNKALRREFAKAILATQAERQPHPAAQAAVPEGLGKAILAGLPHHLSKEERIAIKDRIINALAASAVEAVREFATFVLENATYETGHGLHVQCSGCDAYINHGQETQHKDDCVVVRARAILAKGGA